MTRSEARIARSTHRCDCGATIEPGEPYVHHVCSPFDNDVGNGAGWWRIYECAGCAKRYGREPLIEARLLERAP